MTPSDKNDDKPVSYRDLADSATTFDPEVAFDIEAEKIVAENRAKERSDKTKEVTSK